MRLFLVELMEVMVEHQLHQQVLGDLQELHTVQVEVVEVNLGEQMVLQVQLPEAGVIPMAVQVLHQTEAMQLLEEEVEDQDKIRQELQLP